VRQTTKLGPRVHDHEAVRLPKIVPTAKSARQWESSFRFCRPRITGAEEHNLRAFPLAGIADAAEASGALLKYGELTTPFDLRDGVNVVRNRTEIRVAVVARLPRVHERQHQTQRSPLARPHLVKLLPGGTAAENEHHHLDDYFQENASSAARCAARVVW
jgi:hypothetical protein